MIPLYTGAGGLAAGLLIGWTVHGWNVDSKNVKAQTQAQIEAQEQLITLGADLLSAQEARIELAGALEEEKQNIKIKYVKLKRKVPQHVPANTEKCNYDLSLGLVRLLNAGARGEFGSTESSPGSPGQLFSILPQELAGAPGK